MSTEYLLGEAEAALQEATDLLRDAAIEIGGKAGERMNNLAFISELVRNETRRLKGSLEQRPQTHE